MHQEAGYSLQGAPGGTSPPALPVKQRRSKNSSTSSIQDLEVQVGDLHLSGPQSPVSPFTEVFTTPTDCNAAHCPIHHRYENHQARFFSDQTPPPVPKKSLVRTQSLPVEALDPPCHDHTRTYNYENPLYMISPFLNSETLKEEANEDVHPGQSLQLVTFDTPDEQLYGFFRSFCNTEQVSMGIQECYLQFLKNTLKNIENNIFLNEQENEMAKTSQPTDFLLCGQKWLERDGFYMVHCPKVPGRLFSVKVLKDSVSDSSIPVPHPNIEQVIVHFPNSTAKDQTCTLHSESALTISEPSHGGSTEVCQQQPSPVTEGETIVSFLERGAGVTVVRDFPMGTLDDFVEGGHSLHCTNPEVYERRLCLLILQLTLGLQHLRCYNVISRELKPQCVMLVWPSIKVADAKECLRDIKTRVMNTDTCTGKPEIVISGELDTKMTKGEMCQTIWELLGTPRVVLNSHFENEAFQATTSQEFQLGDLLRFCLHLKDCSPTWKTQQDTPYSAGLLWLVNQLTSEKPGLLMPDVVGVLRALLWGPRKGLFQQNQLHSSILSDWLLLKRSLLVLKLAERGLFRHQHDLDWEDYLCLQYLSFTDPETIRSITRRMGLHDFVRPA